MIYPHTVTLLKATESSSSLGGTNKEYPATGTSYRAFVQPQRESLDVINETGGRNIVVNAYFEPATNAEAKDRFIFSDTTYEITGAVAQYSPTGTHHIKVTARNLDIA